MLKSRTVLNGLVVVCILIALVFASFYIYNQVRVRKVVIATNEAGSQSYDFVAAFVEVIKNEEPKLEIRIVETSGSAEIMDKLRKREADFGVSQIDLVTTQQARTVALLYPQIYHVIVKADSDIRTPADLKGKIIATPSVSGGSFASLSTLLQYYGLTEGDVTVIPFEDGDERDMAFIRGEVDAIFRATTVGNNSIRDLLAKTEARLLTFDQFEAMKIQSPFLFQYEIPKGTYRATDPAIPGRNTLTVGVPTALFANSNVDPDLVRLFTRILFEHQNDIIRRDTLAAFIASPVDEKDVLPAIHPGALLYYERERPGLLEQYYNEISLLFTVIPILASLLFGLQSRFLARQKTKASEYNLELASLLADMMSTSTKKSAMLTEKKLLESLNRVVEDMNEGRISQTDLQTFTLVWEKAMDAVRFRETSLQKSSERSKVKRK